MKADNKDNWQVTVATSFEEIQSIRHDWEKKHTDEDFPTLNADIERYLTVLGVESPGMQPYIMVFSNKGITSGIVIGRIETRQIQCRLGYKTVWKSSLRCLTIVYGGIFGEQTEGFCVKIIAQLQSILKSGTVDMVYLNYLKTDSVIYRLAKTTPNFLCKEHFLKPTLHWQTNVSGSAESFYETIPSKQKREIRRCERRLAEAADGHLKISCYQQEKDVDYILKAACDISASTYKNAMDIGIVDNALTRSLLTQAARSNMLRAYILYVKDVPCAFEFGCHYGRTFFVEYMGYDPKWKAFGLGMILWAKVIEDICSDHSVDILDYGFGNAAYKEKFGTKSWLESSVYIFAPRAYPICINLSRQITTCLSAVLEHLANKAGIRDWVKKKWRNLAQKNSKSDSEILHKAD